MNPLLIIILINVLIYIGVNIRPDLLSYLWLMPADISSHPWQIITSIFTHYEFFHIFANMYTLYFFGTAILQLLGNRKFLIIYLLGGIVGSLFYILLPPNSFPAVGASGAIFALGGSLAVLRPNLRVFVFPIPAALPLWMAVLGGFALLSFVASVAWQAHLGGLLFGALAGYYFRRRGY